MPDEIDLDSLDDQAFRRHIRAWLRPNYPEAWRFSDHELTARETMGWIRALNAKGWGAPGWPKEYGGMGLPPHRQVIFAEELALAGVSRAPEFGVAMVGPLLIQHGSDAQKAYFLPRILSGEILWCQGYSEPGSGSDLASLRTEAVRDGDDFIVNGQKIWTSFAHEADWIFMLVRTDKNAKPQEGISFLLADMKTPGIEVRPIVNIAGRHELNEVFFENVRVPAKNLVGPLNEGWTIAKSLLSFERITVGSPYMVALPLERLATLAAARGAFDDPAFVEKFTRLRLDMADLMATYVRYVDVLRRGGALGPDVSILKIVATETFQRITELALEIAAEPGAQAANVVAGNTETPVADQFFVSRPATIYAGSSEVQRNILAKAVLGLPS